MARDRPQPVTTIKNFDSIPLMSFQVRRVRGNEEPSRLRRLARIALPLTKIFLQLRHHLHSMKGATPEAIIIDKKRKRSVTILLAGLFVVVLLLGTLKVLAQIKTFALGMTSVAGAELQKDANGFTNILLLGQGDNDHDGIDLTDTIMVASLDPLQTKSVVMLSLPRDTYILKTEKMGKGRINSLYRDYKSYLIRQGTDKTSASAEALKELTREVGILLNIEMHGAIKVNFSGFEQGVDLIGGIDVDVPEDLIDPEYPGPNYTYETLTIAKGLHHMSGALALKYVRSRHSTSDFSRSARQQQVISSAITQVKHNGIIKNLTKVNAVLDILSKHFESTLSARELIGLASLGSSIDTQRILSIQLNDQNGLYGSMINQGGFLYSPPREQFDGAAVLLPVSVPETPITWKQVQAFFGLMLKERLLFLRPSPIVIMNAGAKEGSARVMGGELYRYHFNIIKTRNWGGKDSPTYTASFIAVNQGLDGSDDPVIQARRKFALATAKLLSTILGFPIQTIEDPSQFSKENTDIAIVLGKEYHYSPLQDSLQGQ